MPLYPPVDLPKPFNLWSLFLFVLYSSTDIVYSLSMETRVWKKTMIYLHAFSIISIFHASFLQPSNARKLANKIAIIISLNVKPYGHLIAGPMFDRRPHLSLTSLLTWLRPNLGSVLVNSGHYHHDCPLLYSPFGRFMIVVNCFVVYWLL